MPRSHDDDDDEHPHSAARLSRPGVLSRKVAVKEARAQSPRTADVADIVSLSLERRGIREITPGALSGLVALTELDLSRNELTSLRGISEAVNLVSLSLYYNRIVHLDEVKHLGTLKSLQRLDLRLNPLTRDEAYRSYVVFHIPSLQELDERSVRPAERRHAAHTIDAARTDKLNGTSDIRSSSDGITIFRSGDGGSGGFDTDEDSNVSFSEKMRPGIAGEHIAREKRLDRQEIASENKYSNSLVHDHAEKAFGVFASSERPSTNLSRGSESTKDTNSSGQIDALLEEVMTVVASVQLPSQLSLSAVTLIHMPDLVARSARPGLRQVLSRTLSKQASQLSAARDTIRSLSHSLEEARNHAALEGEARERLDQLEREVADLRLQNERLAVEKENALSAAAASQSAIQADQRVLRAQVERDENSNACMEAVNMLRESHRALMHNDAALRSQLKDLQQRYRVDSKYWKKNFRDLQQYYQGLASAPPKNTADASLWPPTPVRHDDDSDDENGTGKANGDTGTDVSFGRRDISAAWGSRITRDAEATMNYANNYAGAESNKSHGKGYPESEKSTPLKSLGYGIPKTTASSIATKRSERSSNEGQRYVGSLHKDIQEFQTSKSPIKQREAEQEQAKSEIIGKLQWAHAMSSAKQAIENNA